MQCQSDVRRHRLGWPNLCYSESTMARLNDGSPRAMELAPIVMEILVGDTFFLVPHRRKFEDEFFLRRHDLG
jgi:hypothetical protein